MGVMSNEILKQRAALTNDEIRNLVDKVNSLADDYPNRERMKLTLTLEQILLEYQAAFGSDKEIQLLWTKEFFRGSRITVSLEGQECNPLLMAHEEDQEIIEYTQRMLSILGLGVNYQYRRGSNIVMMKLPGKQKLTMLHQIWISALVAVVTLFILQFMPAEVAKTFTDDFVTRIFKKMVSVLATLATPMIFFALLMGIRNIGNVSSLGKMGKTLCMQLSKPYIIAAVLAPFAYIVSYPLSSESGSGGAVFGSLFQLVLDIIPNDLVTPLQINNDMQIIVIAVLVGTTLLTMKGDVPHLDKLIDESANLVNRMMALACKFLPVLIYFGIISVGSQMDPARLLDIYRFALSGLVVQAIIISFVVFKTYRQMGKPLKEILQPTVPALMINLATGSQMAAYPASEKACKEDWKIEPKLFDFAFPMGVVLYMPNGAILLAMATWLMLYIAGMPADISMLIKVSILGVIVSIAAPPIPGSGLVVLPIMMSGVNIPMDFMPVGVLYITLIGHFMPAMNGFCLQLEMLSLGKKLGMLKEAV